MPSDVEIGAWNLREAGPVLALVNRIQPHVPWTERFFRWQYRDNPAGEGLLWAATRSDRVVGLYGAVPRRLTIGGHQRMAWRIQDIMTEPAYRGHGVMHRLAEACEDSAQRAGVDLLIGLPNESSIGHLERRGWNSWGTIPGWRHDLSPLDSSAPEGIVTLQDISAVPTIEADRRCEPDRSAEWLRWRYSRHPQGNFHAFSRAKDVGGASSIIVKIYVGPPRRAHICEIFSTEESATATQELLVYAVDFARRQAASELTLWAEPAGKLARLLQTAGFRRYRSERRFMIRCLDPSLAPLAQKWPLSMGDSDVY